MDTATIFCFLTTYLLLLSTTRAQTCEQFPVVDLGYVKHRPTVVNTTILHNISYATYANIRFAQPPVGELRFRKPQLPPPSNSTVQDGVVPRNATNCLISIPHELEQNIGINGTSWGSEDCLFLDVKVPEGVIGRKVPVLLWFYGGGYFFGSKEPWAGDTAALFQGMAPEGKFITVASNYRLGGLGWLSPGIQGVDKNVGLYDCLAALDWVRQYISHFGGDPDDITIIGESTGGGLGAQLLVAYGGTKDMGIKKAILTSSGIHPYPNRQPDFDRQWNIFLQAANCSDVACIRALSTDAIASVNRELIFNLSASEGWIGPGIGYGGPIPDGDAVPDVAFRLLANGKFDPNIQKVLAGGMLNDGQYLLVSSPQNWTDFLRVFMKTPTASAIQRVMLAYPGDFETASNSFAGDAVFKCHGYFMARGFGNNAYRYEMSIPPAQHGQDQYYYWYGNGTSPTDPAVRSPAVAFQMQDYIRSLVLDNYPGGGGCDRPHWPSYGDAGRWMNITADGFQLVPAEGAAIERCALLLDLMNDPANGW